MGFDFDGTVLAACMDAFGEQNPDGTPSILYMPGHAAPYDVTGVFDSAYTELKFEGEAAVQSRRPMLGARASAFLGLPPCRGELFRICGTVYTVQEVHPDGHGHLKIYMQETKGKAR